MAITPSVFDSLFGPTHDWRDRVSLIDRPHKTPTRPWESSLELAGIKKANIAVSVKGDFVKIKWTTRLGEVKDIQTFIGGKYYDMDELECKFEDGLLTVIVPLKQAPPEPLAEPEKQIEIK